jgi:hypothetical protein
VRYPYLQLRRAELPSLVRELKTRDYRTLAIHPNGGALESQRCVSCAGFDRFTTQASRLMIAWPLVVGPCHGERLDF